MVLSEHDVVADPVRLEDDREVVVRIFIDLGSLVLVPDVLDGERVELEGLLEELVVVFIRLLDVEPQALVMRVGETSVDDFQVMRVGAARGCQHRPHGWPCYWREPISRCSLRSGTWRDPRCMSSPAGMTPSLRSRRRTTSGACRNRRSATPSRMDSIRVMSRTSPRTGRRCSGARLAIQARCADNRPCSRC